MTCRTRGALHGHLIPLSRAMETSATAIREVTSVDDSTLGTNGSGAKTVDVTYHYQIAKVASWANSQEMKTAYPGIASALGTNPADKATLVMTGDHWEFTK